MDFFRFDSNGPTNDGSPVAKAIDQATDPMLITTDWGKNLEICDMINTGGQAAVTSSTRMLRRQLRSDQPKSVMLALELVDTCVKNCAFELHQAVASKAFMGDVVSLAEGKKGFETQQLSLRLIQQWGNEFKATRSELPGFLETYMSLKIKGAAFPEAEATAPVFSPPPQIAVDEPPISSNPSASMVTGGGGGGGAVAAAAPASVSGSAPASSGPGASGPARQVAMDKLRQDLVAVEEKVRLCRDMLPESPGIEHDEALSEVVGFLEACQPRLSDLIEAGMQGILSEDLLSHTLHVNDELQKTLEAERSGTPISPMTGPQGSPSTPAFVPSPEDVVAASASSAAAASAALDLMTAEDEEPSLYTRRSGRRKGRKAATPPTSSSAAGTPSLLPEPEASLSMPVGEAPTLGEEPRKAAAPPSDGALPVHADLMDLALPAMPEPQDPGPPPSYLAATIVPPPKSEPVAAAPAATTNAVSPGALDAVAMSMTGIPTDQPRELPPAQSATMPPAVLDASASAVLQPTSVLTAPPTTSAVLPAPAIQQVEVLSVLPPPGGDQSTQNPFDELLQGSLLPPQPASSTEPAPIEVAATLNDPELQMYQAPSAEAILSQSQSPEGTAPDAVG